jgi:diacylglycerol kinase family enzyme
MRILLLHNPNAGREEHEAEDLVKALAQAGHEAIYQSSKKKGIRKAIQNEIDLVLVAGGDGAVGKAARYLIGSKIPLSILPLGTANNMARTLGFTASAETLIAKISQGKRRAFDVGLARGPWGKRYFFEGAGAGLFADYLLAPRKEAETGQKISKAEEMKRHVVEMRRQLQDYKARPWRIELDGKDCTGRYLLWQVMNIRSVGPVLTLAPGARTDDGELDFIGAREEDRGVLLDYLDARLAGTKVKFPLRTKRFKKMRVRWKKSPLHFDDQVWPEEGEERPEPCEIEITVKGSALGVWSEVRKKKADE